MVDLSIMGNVLKISVDATLDAIQKQLNVWEPR